MNFLRRKKNKIDCCFLISFLFNVSLLFGQSLKKIEFENVQIEIPKSVNKISESEKKSKYLEVDLVPDIAFHDLDDKIIVTIKKTNIQLEENQYLQLKNNILNQFNTTYVNVIENDIKIINGDKIVLTKIIYKNRGFLLSNIIFSLKGYMYIISISISNELKRYEVLNNKIIHSFRINKN